MPFHVATFYYFGRLALKSRTRIAASVAPVNFIKNTNIGSHFIFIKSESGW